jgi:hypothetical protein
MSGANLQGHPQLLDNATLEKYAHAEAKPVSVLGQEQYRKLGGHPRA